jgi:6-phosphogluconolactonase/glucosamine-6-phosphate isomerase/deaminase
MYRALVAEYRDRPQWRTLRFVGLDEYAGLPPDDPRLFSLWVAKECLDPLSVPLENRMRFASDAPDADVEARQMNEWLLANGPPGSGCRRDWQ